MRRLCHSGSASSCRIIRVFTYKADLKQIVAQRPFDHGGGTHVWFSLGGPIVSVFKIQGWRAIRPLSPCPDALAAL